MLQHEEQAEQIQPPKPLVEGEPAANVRVTAEEFARALTRYQARREQAAQRMEGTVAIGDAVHELGLDATPEEILAEVQAERASEAARLSQTVNRTVPRRGIRFIAAGVAAGLVMLSFGLVSLRTTVQPTGPATVTAVQIQTVTASPFVTLTAPSTLLVQDTSSGTPVLKTLGEIPDNVPVRCALEMTAAQASFANFSSGNEPTTWTLIKHSGQIYVRGWIAAMSPQAIRSSAVSIYSQKSFVPAGFAPTPITVRLDGFQTNPALGSDDTIVAEHIQTDDTHFAERW